MPLPDVLVVGAPKAGSTAVHAALSTHAGLFMSVPKETMYFLCGDQPPGRQAGPGDAHSAKEWIWQRERYEALFADAPDGALLGESTPFYLWSTEAHRRIAEVVPRARLIAVVRDPVDRAYSNWGHLWCDGYEPVGDLASAVDLEEERIERGYAPFWRYVDLGRYGSQLEHLYRYVSPDRVHVIRYRDLVDRPEATLTGIARFLDVDPRGFATVPDENVSSWAGSTPADQVLRGAIRAGAWTGQHLPPGVWRALERPLRRALRRGSTPRPPLTTEVRRAVQRHFVEDVERLGDLTGDDYRGWLGEEGLGAYSVRRSWAPSGREAS